MQNRYRSAYNRVMQGVLVNVCICTSGIEFLQKVHVYDYHACISNHNVV
jgi:hypothetical protein